VEPSLDRSYSSPVFEEFDSDCRIAVDFRVVAILHRKRLVMDARVYGDWFRFKSGRRAVTPQLTERNRNHGENNRQR
jgi:hypothetical protein